MATTKLLFIDYVSMVIWRIQLVHLIVIIVISGVQHFSFAPVFSPVGISVPNFVFLTENL